MKLSLYRGGYANLTSTEVIDDWSEFVDLVSNPQIGPKNGDYFIRGYCDGDRSNNAVASMDLIIIDGDQLIDNGSSCCAPQPVHNIMIEKNITHVIYNSFSNDIVNNRHKWRLCVPCNDLIDAESLRRGVMEIITIMQDAGLMVRNVGENLVLSQPWFLPRCTHETIEDFFCAWFDGDIYRLGTVEKLHKMSGIITVENEGKHGDTGAGCFSWEYALGQFQAGTIHQGIKSICGWLIYTTNWSDSQIKKYLITHIQALCPDKIKVARAVETKEIDDLIKYCRQKQGVVDMAANWKEHLTTAAKLKETEFPEIRWAVDGIIPEGLCVLAGEPKIGKSLIAVNICSAIASGVEAFGQRKCVVGTCCYISLEDKERRVKARIKQQCDLWPDRFKLLTNGVPVIGPDFYRLLDEMVMMWPDLRAIVIDVLQKVIPQKNNNVADYDHYYKVLDPLHDWAMQNHVAVILITHKNKSKDDDASNPFSGIIGSVAIQGTADALVLLTKNHAKAKDPGNHDLADGFLTITGREVTTEKISLEFNSEALTWVIRGEFKPVDATGNVNWMLIASVLSKSPLSPAGVRDMTGLNNSTVKSCLNRMCKAGILLNNEGIYSLQGANYKNEF